MDIQLNKKKIATRPKVETGNGDGELMEPDFDEERFGDYLSVLGDEFLVKNFPEQRLRALCQNLSDTLDRCRKRLQRMEQQRTALLCSHCQKRSEEHTSEPSHEIPSRMPSSA